MILFYRIWWGWICFCIFFLVLKWNLVDHSDNVINENVDHVYWTKDSLVLQFTKSKSDQFGKNVDKLFHVCYKPNNPITCPVLYLYWYKFSNPCILMGGDKSMVNKWISQWYSHTRETRTFSWGWINISWERTVPEIHVCVSQFTWIS